MIKVTREPATLTPAIEVEQGRHGKTGVIPLRDHFPVCGLTDLPDQPVADYVDFDKKQRIEQVRLSIARKQATGTHIVRVRDLAG